jgi:integrase
MAKATKTKAGYHVVSYRDEQGRGRTRSFGKGVKAKEEARKFATEIDYKKAHDEPLPISRGEGLYLNELCQLWVNQKLAQGRKDRWLTEWTETFNKVFFTPLCKHPAHRITQADVIAIVGANYSGRAQATRNRYVGYLKSIFEYGVEQGHLKTNPLSKWKGGKEPRRKSQLTLEDLKSIQAVCAPHLAWALDVAWAIPCRPGPTDLYALRFDRNVKPGRNGVEVYHSKVGKWAFIQLDEWFMRSLAIQEKIHTSGHLIEYKGKPVDRLDTSLDTAAKRVGLTYSVCMYDVRHLWITTALDKGIEPSAIAYMAGTSVEMIHKNYYEPHAAEKARAVEIMPKLHVQKLEPGRKVVGIDEAGCRKPCRKKE